MKTKFNVKFLILGISFFLSFEVKSTDETLSENEKKRLQCITKHMNDSFKKRKKKIIHRACEKLISNNERNQKIAECTLKEIGKHSLAVLIVKQNNCIHHFMHNKYK